MREATGGAQGQEALKVAEFKLTHSNDFGGHVLRQLEEVEKNVLDQYQKRGKRTSCLDALMRIIQSREGLRFLFPKETRELWEFV